MRHTIKLISFIFLFSALILAGFASTRQEEQEYARLEGKILDMEKKPISQAEIQLVLQGTNQTASVKSNKKGDFTFRMLFPGKYTLTASREGYATYSMELELEPEKPQRLEITLAKELSPEQKNTQEAFASFQKGIEFAQANKIDEAIEAFRKASELKTDFFEAFINLGALLFQQSKDEEAETALLRALELKPDESKVKQLLGNIAFEKAKALLQEDKFDEALAELNKSVSYNPNYSYTHYLFGYTYQKKGMKEEAIKSFETFLALDPNAPQAAQVKQILEDLKK